MQWMIAAAPELREAACAAHLPIANAAYRIQKGALCALPMAAGLRCGALLLNSSDGSCSQAVVQSILQECARRRYGTVIVPFPAPALTASLARHLYRAGISLWVHETCAHAAPGGMVLVCTAMSGGDIQRRLRECCRAFGADRIVLDLQRLRMDFPLPCPTGEGVPLTGEQLCRLQKGRQVFYSKELGARYFTYRRGGSTRFVLLDDGDTLRRKAALGEQLGIRRGLLTLPECGDVWQDVIKKETRETDSQVSRSLNSNACCGSYAQPQTSCDA